MSSLRTALTLALTAAAATLAPATAAMAAAPAPAGAAVPDSALLDAAPTQTLTTALGAGVEPVRHLPLDPLSNTGVDPLDNGLGSQVADFKPLSTTTVTDQVTRGGSLSTLPLAGPATGLLTG
ncbi:hypothetical protein NMG29_33790 [Streptomyces cocklensis]|uniref:ATP-binding protein n=1 Tax=Actinacidiphila cocklensis TaxID=887465 RepID=A0A9W4DQ22_9ACTN|nr:hypothetical protein [Actinacidiphila cocklensis]MDD1063106.1 hypothetical protein [Actinacidiphila cocklensis]WSX77176.1 hypothetical protein OH826_27035 [Streptomyces sp. NBC_00899]CAG6395545.1 conserved exported hypothetical protein [Actinacidiphila cocklensis]